MTHNAVPTRTVSRSGRRWWWGGLVAAAVVGSLVVTTVGAGPAWAIAGGTKVRGDREAPWMATLALKGSEPLPQRSSCGGALVAPTKVLTAAHCVAGPEDELARKAEYHIGARVLSRGPGRVAGIAAVDTHPRYRLVPSPEEPDDPSASSAAYDVAVITLDRPVKGVPTLPVSSSAPPEGAVATLYGHGITGPGSGVSDTLRRGAYRIGSDARCDRDTSAVVDRRSMLCGRGLRAAACTGDSGGPLVVRTNGRREIAGVFSFGMETEGRACGSPGPNFFTDTAATQSWIEDQLAEVG